MKGWVNGKCVGWSRQWQIKGLHSCIFCTNSRRSTAMPACNSIVAAIYCSQTMCAATDVCNAVLTLLCRPSTSQQTQMVRQYATSAAAISTQHSCVDTSTCNTPPPTSISTYLSREAAATCLCPSHPACLPSPKALVHVHCISDAVCSCPPAVTVCSAVSAGFPFLSKIPAHVVSYHVLAWLCVLAWRLCPAGPFMYQGKYHL